MPDRFSLDEIRDLFREDVERFLDGMRAQLKRLLANPRDRAALDQLRGYGHSLKGSAGLVGLTYLSQAGAVIDRVGEVATGYLQSDTTEALSAFRQAQDALPHIEELLEHCLRGADPGTQENIYTAFTLAFSERLRRYLYTVECAIPAGAVRHGTATGDPSVDEQFVRELAAAFHQELHENLKRVPDLVSHLTSTAHQRQAFYDLSRIFHTIKGSAAMVGNSHLSDLAKYLQDTFGNASDSLDLPADSHDTLQAALDGVFTAAGLTAPPLCTELAPPTADTPAELEVDPELLDAFIIDATEAIEASERLLLELERHPDDRDKLHALFRHFHTLKGAAAAVGLDQVAEQMHEGESLLEGVLGGEVQVDNVKLVNLLFRLTDSVTALIGEARGVADSQHCVIADIGAEIALLVKGKKVAAAAKAKTVKKRTSGRASAPPQPTPANLPTEEAPLTAAPGVDLDSGMVRIHGSRLDTLMNQVTQLVVSRTRMDRKIEAFTELRDKLDYCRRRLTDLIQGFQEHYEYTLGDRSTATTPSLGTSETPFTDLEFDKYDDVNILARSVIELASDSGEVADQLGRTIDSFGEDSRQFSKITTSLQRNITRLRLVPLDTVFRRLLRPVRDAARQEGKLVDLQIEGADVQLDKAIVEGLHAPLLHLVRNAVSHGIEVPAARQAAGKPTAGTIRLTAQPRHNSVLIEVKDDGTGVDYGAVLAKGRALGLVAPGATPSREQLIPLIFRPGFSTGETVTDLAGRGVGMDVVARDIAALNGSVLVDSKDHQGTSIRMVLPTTTTIDEVLLLHTGAQRYAIGADFIEQAVSVDLQELIEVDGQRMLQVRNELLPVLLLGPLAEEPPPLATSMALILRAGDRAMALVVDRIEAQREAVIRPLGRVLEAHPFLAGATIAGDGSVIFTLHVGRLFDVLAAEASHQATFILGASTDGVVVAPEAILVVDDSISVRKLASRFLETEGLDIDTAVDGLDALEKLNSGRFRLVVTDLEMPRMHGYELIAEIRRQPQLQHLPIIVCSSRSSEKHRSHARAVGAQGYITKPFTKEQLLAEIARVAGPTAVQPSAYSMALNG
jgi:chemosensory pili system protein ChpA (sensor histidine kinase/response regulator)